MEKINLSTNLVNAILQYLGTQPYLQVANIISNIQQEAQGQLGANSENTPETK
jgi:hypothetical protein